VVERSGRRVYIYIYIHREWAGSRIELASSWADLGRSQGVV
jgi:hypothetical protein